MTTAIDVQRLSETDVRRLDVSPAGVVDLRRDVHLLVCYVEEQGLVRTRRGNEIPLTVARRLAARLSWAGEKEAVEEHRAGVWSDYVADLARVLGLLSYDTQGVYVGYSSTEPSFLDNEVTIEEKAWRAWRRKGAREKERAILAALVETRANEFFHRATLVPGACFDTYGSAIGPAGKMELPRIRRTLLEFLATLEPGAWFDLRSVVDLLGSRHPTLILDPAHRDPTRASQQARLRSDPTRRDRRQGEGGSAQLEWEDIYSNFREYDAKKDRWTSEARRQLTSGTPDVFHRVEGRYVEFFLREIPYVLGFVDLAYRPPSDRHGLDVAPPFERLRALRTTERLRAVMRSEAEFEKVKVTVLPTFEVLVEAPSYPDATLDDLAPFASVLSEDGRIHRLRLERDRVTQAAASDAQAPACAALLEKMSGRPLPQNVAFNLARWTARGGQVVLYEGLGLLEIAGGDEARREAQEALGDLAAEALGDGFILVREPDVAFERLEAKGLVPRAVDHPEGGFAPCGGPLGSRAEGKAPRKGRAGVVAGPPAKARLRLEDLVGYRCDAPALLAALRKALPEGACFVVGGDLLVLPAAFLPALRETLRSLGGRFEVTFEEGAPVATDVGRPARRRRARR